MTLFIFPVAGGTVKTPGSDRRLRPSTLIRDHHERGEEKEVFRKESDELVSPTPLQDDSTRDDAEAKNDFWSITEEMSCMRCESGRETLRKWNHPKRS